MCCVRRKVRQGPPRPAPPRVCMWDKAWTRVHQVVKYSAWWGPALPSCAHHVPRPVDARVALPSSAGALLRAGLQIRRHDAPSRLVQAEGAALGSPLQSSRIAGHQPTPTDRIGCHRCGLSGDLLDPSSPAAAAPGHTASAAAAATAAAASAAASVATDFVAAASSAIPITATVSGPSAVAASVSTGYPSAVFAHARRFIG